MGALRVILTLIFILVCIVLSAIVLMQEGKSAGLGAISGMAETYWGKNQMACHCLYGSCSDS